MRFIITIVTFLFKPEIGLFEIALIFPAWPYRVASQCLRSYPGFIKSFFVTACSVFLFFGIRWRFYSTNSLKQKGLLACAVEWKGMPVFFFFSWKILILCHYYEREMMFLCSILISVRFTEWAPRVESWKARLPSQLCLWTDSLCDPQGHIEEIPVSVASSMKWESLVFWLWCSVLPWVLIAERLWQSCLITPTPVSGRGWFQLKLTILWDSFVYF